MTDNETPANIQLRCIKCNAELYTDDYTKVTAFVRKHSGQHDQMVELHTDMAIKAWQWPAEEPPK